MEWECRQPCNVVELLTVAAQQAVDYPLELFHTNWEISVYIISRKCNATIM